MSQAQLFKKYKTNEFGLNVSEVKKRIKRYGRNDIITHKNKSLWYEFFKEFKDLMVVILLIAAIISGLSGEYVDTFVIFFIVVLNACIGFYQKIKADNAMEALKKMVSIQAQVIRNKEVQLIDAKELVPGDILIIHEGSKISADGVLFEVNELQVQESILTGESTTISKSINSSSESSKVYTGTTVTHGSGKLIVTETGTNTKFGEIAHLTSSVKQDKSPLEKEISKIGIYVSKLTLTISTILVIVNILFLDSPIHKAILFAVSIAVAAVPEGLPTTVTIALSLGAKRLASKNAIIKQLSSVETLGCTTVICSDKTGTLTKNEMTVKQISLHKTKLFFQGSGYEPSGIIHIEDSKNNISLINNNHNHTNYSPSALKLNDLEIKNTSLYKNLELGIEVLSICNTAELIEKDDKWSIIGDPTEGALLTATEKSGFSINKLRKKYKIIHQYPFDSDSKTMSIVIQDKATKNYYLYTKGAPENILRNTTHFQSHSNKGLKMTDQRRSEILTENKEMAKQALRVLGFAYKKLNSKEIKSINSKERLTKIEMEENLIYIGIVGMIDPPRQDVKEAIKQTYTAGIRTYIVTGDNGNTALAIAKQISLINKEDTYKIIEGKDLEKLSKYKLKKLLSNKELKIIFARVSPAHKLRIVETLKELKEIVAVTGDGINDAPALKRADIGIAMGITGTDVSKEAANMILSDDSFSTIVEAIKEGRTIYQNLKKFIFYILSCNIGELITVFIAIIFQLPLPLTAILILTVDLGTDVLPAIALGTEKTEEGIMNLPPRSRDSHIINLEFGKHFLFIGLTIGALIITLFLFILKKYGWNGELLSENSYAYTKASTVAFCTLVLAQMANTLNARNQNQSITRSKIFNNTFLNIAVLISVLLTIMIVNIPFLQQAFNTTYLSLSEWLLILIASFSIVIIEEFRKLIFYKKYYAR